MNDNMNKSSRVKQLIDHLNRTKIPHAERIMALSTLKDAHVYCVLQRLSAQQYGPLIERFIQTKFGYSKNNSQSCSGDCNKDGLNSEVKVSLGGSSHTRFNFVQLRPTHDCDAYIFTAYHLSLDNVESEGELYIFNIPKIELKNLIASFGGYAHGTTREYGPITKESMTREYAIRSTINDTCWNALLTFRIPESSL